MFIKRSSKSKRGFTLIEVLVASGIFGVASVALCSIYLFSTKSFVTLANYAELDKINRNAVDTLTREIRQARQVVDVQANSISIINGDNHSITYSFNSATKQLLRTDSSDPAESSVLVSDCDLLVFELHQRNPIDGSFDIYPVATGNWSEEVKVIRLTWKASRRPNNSPITSENIQTAQIVIRKQH